MNKVYNPDSNKISNLFITPTTANMVVIFLNSRSKIKKRIVLTIFLLEVVCIIPNKPILLI